MKIYPTDSGYVISENEVWRPGFFADQATATRASSLSDEVLSALMDAANARSGGAGGIITAADLKAAATPAATWAPYGT